MLKALAIANPVVRRGCLVPDRSSALKCGKARLRDERTLAILIASYSPAYGCLPDSPTQQVLDLLGRHGQRLAHIHYFISAPGHQHLTTQINLAGDPYTFDDFAFATREELVVEGHRVEDAAAIEARGFEGSFTEVMFDVALSPTDAAELQVRHKRPQAKEDEQNQASQQAGTAKVGAPAGLSEPPPSVRSLIMTSKFDRLEQHIHGAVVDGAEAGTFRVHRSIFTFTAPRVLDHHLAVLRRAAQVRPRQGRAAGTRHCWRRL
ncbi:dioxygenase family protein [Salinicola sp. V024]|uniref:dioxygenase family protein n=1 Tax=Salinicola sp. V024 TaxID=3459609 RepID=UPI0040450979